MHDVPTVSPLRAIRRDCAHKRWEYQLARQVYVEAGRLAVHDRRALEHELKEALLAYYSAHGALHAALRANGRWAQLH